MATEQQTSMPTSSSSSDKNVYYYIHDADLPDLSPSVQKFFEQYSKIPANQVQAHVLELRERAWQIFPYPCIGNMAFLDFSLSTMPSYDRILRTLSNKDDPKTLLDFGCCFGQDVRKLLLDGAPASHVVGVELKAEFIDLGYDLFKDRDSFQGRFIAGDILDDAPGSAVNALNGTIDIVHVALVLHLFGWDGQLKAALRLVSLLKNQPGTVVLGRQVGSSEPGEYRHAAAAAGVMYKHDGHTFRKLWDEIEEQTGTKWKVEASLESVGMLDGLEEFLCFEVTRTE